MKAEEAKRLKELEEENKRLKKLLAEAEQARPWMKRLLQFETNSSWQDLRRRPVAILFEDKPWSALQLTAGYVAFLELIQQQVRRHQRRQFPAPSFGRLALQVLIDPFRLDQVPAPGAAHRLQIALPAEPGN